MGYYELTESEIEMHFQPHIEDLSQDLAQIDDKPKFLELLSQNGATRFKAFGIYAFWVRKWMGDAQQFKWLFEYMMSHPLTEVNDKYRPYLNDGELNDMKYWAVAQSLKSLRPKAVFFESLNKCQYAISDIEELGDVLQRREPCPQFDDDHREWLKDYYDALNLADNKDLRTYLDSTKKLGEAHGKAAFRECLSKLLPIPNPNKDDGNDVEILRRLADIDDVKQKWFEEYVEECKSMRQSTKPDEPDLINTPRVIKYFARAIEMGFMKKTEQGYEWLYGMPRGKVRLAYFLEKVYRDLPTAQIPYKELNMLFGVNRLDSAYNQIKSDGDSQKVKLWKEQIDKLFYD